MEHAHVVTHTHIYTHTQQCVLHRACTRTHTHTYISCTRTHAPNYTPLHICTFMCAARSITRTHTHAYTPTHNTQNQKNKTTCIHKTHTHKRTNTRTYTGIKAMGALQHIVIIGIAVLHTQTNKHTHTGITRMALSLTQTDTNTHKQTHWYHTNGFITRALAHTDSRTQ